LLAFLISAPVRKRTLIVLCLILATSLSSRGRVVAGKMKGVLYVAFERWREGGAQDLRHQRLVSQTLGRLSGRAITRGYSTWKANVKEAKRLRGRASRAALKLLQARLSRGFERWREWAAEARKLQTSARRVLLRLQQRGLTAGYARWRQRAAEERQLRMKMTRVIKVRCQRISRKGRNE
jgi:hypothetical protein